MNYVIATDSRKKDEVLFMVDRNKQRKSFWSNQLTDVFVTDKAAADKIVAGLRFNNPRVLTLADAQRIVGGTQQASRRYPLDYEDFQDDIHPFSQEAFEA
jgi:hypothetical protein